MALAAFYLGMLTIQRKFCLVVIKLTGEPGFRIMASSAIRSALHLKTITVNILVAFSAR